MEHTMGSEGILSEAIGLLNKTTNSGDLLAQTELARTEDSTLDLDHVLETVEHGIDSDHIAISHTERGLVELLDIEDTITIACLTDHTNTLVIGIARETSGIAQQGGHTLGSAHLIVHGALDIASDTDQTIVGAYLNDIAILEADVTCQTTIQDILVDIDNGDKAATTKNLDITQGTKVLDASSGIKGMEDAGKGTEMVGTRRLHFAHDVDEDGARLSNTDLQTGTAITGAQTGTDLGVGGCYSQA